MVAPGSLLGSLCTGLGFSLQKSVELVLWSTVFGFHWVLAPASLTEPVPRAIGIVRTAVIAG